MSSIIDAISDEMLRKVKLQEINLTEKFDAMSKQEKLETLATEFRSIVARIGLYESIYNLHDCDSYEHIFRDHEKYKLTEIARGIQYAMRNLLRDDDDTSEENNRESGEKSDEEIDHTKA